MDTTKRRHDAMSKIEWTPNLSVGVTAIDNQHKQWIQRMADLSAAIASNRGVEHISKTLSFLVDYTSYHFSAEETLMREKAYPDLATHHAQHEELRKTLSELVRDFEEEGATHELARFTDTFLMNWLTEHIRTMDTKVGAFLRAHN
jgi:hemerythrin